MRKWLPFVLLCACPLLADKYTGPRPPKPDLPYLLHADTLVATEAAEAKQEERKNEVTYVIPGANSTARTPLASPIFLLLTDELQADRMQVFRLQSKGGQREVLFTRKKKQVARPIRVNVTRLDDNLYKIEVDELLENGEYSLSPSDSNKVFCFQIY
ncbi:MAG TPA: hypothetical protein VKR61_17585 [Bryobacteraceae bacterium]|nr:hypothetical protein [Bryobacteraceae bacterium]